MKILKPVLITLASLLLYNCGTEEHLKKYNSLKDFKGSIEKYSGNIETITFKRHTPIKYPGQDGTILKVHYSNDDHIITFYEGNGNWELDGLRIQNNSQSEGVYRGNFIDESVRSNLLKNFQPNFEEYLDSILVRQQKPKEF